VEKGEWSVTLQGKTGDPIPLKGNWSVIREGDDWKIGCDSLSILVLWPKIGFRSPFPKPSSNVFHSPRFNCGNLLWLVNELSALRVKENHAGCLHAVVNEDIL
jgi:hypothetical protein